MQLTLETPPLAIYIFIFVILFFHNFGMALEYKISGFSRTNPESIIKYRFGNQCDNPEDIVKALHETGLFRSINAEIYDNIINVTVLENPFVTDIKFTGNSAISSSNLRNALSFKPYAVLNMQKVVESVNQIIRTYNDSGFLSATASAIEHPLSNGRSKIEIRIKEGQKTSVSSIEFSGNSFMSDKSLRKNITTHSSKMIPGFLLNNTFSPETISKDENSLARFYGNKGFPFFEVEGVVVTCSKIRKKHVFGLIYKINEGGQRSKFGNVEIDNIPPGVEPSHINHLIKIKEGTTFSAKNLETSTTKITEFLNLNGHPFAYVTPLLKQVNNEIVDVTLNIENIDRYRIGAINVIGNVVTDEDVVRRELVMREGDDYNLANSKASFLNIVNLGFFSGVEITPPSISSPGVVDLNVEVTEKPSGEIRFGANYQYPRVVGGQIVYTNDNWLGRGQYLAISLDGSTCGYLNASASFSEPYVGGRPVGFGIGASHIQENGEIYHAKITSAGVSMTARDLYSGNVYGLSYSNKLRTITSINPNIPLAVQENIKDTQIGSIGFSFSLDRRNSSIYPTDGFAMSTRYEFGGIPTVFSENSADVNSIGAGIELYSLLSSHESEPLLTLIAKYNQVYAADRGDTISAADRYYVAPIRGLMGIGPIHTETGILLGGNNVFSLKVQFDSKFNIEDTVDLRGFTFYDVGNVFGIDDVAIDIVDDKMLRQSVGIGILWLSRFAPIRIYYAWPLTASKYDIEKKFGFSIGSL